ncbi:MAG: hypothetical protein Q4G09_01260 [Clostridia bacterium]|nr:hypothetical protein [Clostridia bacterium]
MKKTIIGLIGIEIDDNYKWKDTLIIDENVASMDEKEYLKCKEFIKVKYNKKIDYSKARKIEEKIYGCEEYIYDHEKKTKIYFKNETTCVIETNQEANEWIMIMLNIMLLKQNYSIIHAAAVSNEKGALLLPSWGGVGKTASVAKLIKKGYKLLGDDMNIIDEKGIIYPLPKKFVLYFYHKDLFPEVFSKKGPRCNNFVNNIYELIKQPIKRVLRCIPGLLAYLRKHNPQSIRVSPVEIFGKDVIGNKTNINQIIWIERGNENSENSAIDYKTIANKAVSVTLNEIFGSNMSAILTMCGFNQLEITDIFEKMYKIYLEAFKNTQTKYIKISTMENVSKVADEVIRSSEE